MTAEIQFARGVTEEAVPDVRITRSRSGDSGTATFYFEKPKALELQEGEEITGMYLIDDEGEISTQEVKGKFVNGQPSAIEAVVVMKSSEEWERFIRFMNRYAEEQGLELTRS
ncbi:MAG: photosystem II reaction center protein Psb28 [Kamptonema sp. SIO4C4]|nr:photosystem II reaction center protein Psb28 [Kamptonema sp. SIO4C4]